MNYFAIICDFRILCVLLQVKRNNIYTINKVNYEELLAAKDHGKLNIARQPIGEYYRMKVDGKYRGIVDIWPEMNENIVFSEALKKECEKNATLTNHRQLHFTPVVENGEVRQLEIEQGSYMSFEQLLNDNPAVVASKGFIDDTLKGLVDITSYLHDQGIRHICYSPKTVFVRKGDNAVMLLSHGSFYLGISDLQSFYGDDARFVAPEVLNHGTIDDRCDVYSMGKFMEVLFEQSDMPMEYKRVLKQAIGEAPEDRYNRPEDLLKALKQKRGFYKSLISLVLAFVIGLICVGIYFEMFPESNQVEFVEPAPRQATDDLLDDGFSPEELGVVSADSVTAQEEEADEQTRQEYQAKAEAIFRKKYEKEADRILSKIYNTSYMNSSEKKFMAESQETLKELMELQQTLGDESSLTPERSQLIASQIIERISNEKKRALTRQPQQ